MKYNDQITMIRRGGSGKHGKIPDSLMDVIFIKLHETDGLFIFLYPNDPQRRLGQGYVNDIITVNNEPI